MIDSKQKIAVLGAGSWGTALAALVARHAYPTILWGRDVGVIQSIDIQRQNFRYLPSIMLPQTLRATTDLAAAVSGADWVLVAVPLTPSLKLYVDWLHCCQPALVLLGQPKDLNRGLVVSYTRWLVKSWG